MGVADAGKHHLHLTATYEGKRLAAPVITWKPTAIKVFMTTLIKC